MDREKKHRFVPPVNSYKYLYRHHHQPDNQHTIYHISKSHSRRHWILSWYHRNECECFWFQVKVCLFKCLCLMWMYTVQCRSSTAYWNVCQSSTIKWERDYTDRTGKMKYSDKIHAHLRWEEELKRARAKRARSYVKIFVIILNVFFYIDYDSAFDSVI